MNEHAKHPSNAPRASRRRLALAGLLALAVASGPSPAGATRPAGACAALDTTALCFTERIPGFGEAGPHGFGRGSMALAGARGRSRRPHGARRRAQADRRARS